MVSLKPDRSTVSPSKSLHQNLQWLDTISPSKTLCQARGRQFVVSLVLPAHLLQNRLSSLDIGEDGRISRPRVIGFWLPPMSSGPMTNKHIPTTSDLSIQVSTCSLLLLPTSSIIQRYSRRHGTKKSLSDNYFFFFLFMKCPKCKNLDTKVIDSRATEDGKAIRRRRECEKC